MAKKARETIKNKFVRCIDCKLTQPLGEFTIRCAIYKVGKVKKSARLCDHFESK